jgi:hypothetical protein
MASPPRPTRSPDPNLNDILTRIAEAIPLSAWSEASAPPGVLRVLSGVSPEWRIMLCEFELVDGAGKPAGRIGYDGTATCLSEPLVVRLTPALALAAAEASR